MKKSHLINLMIIFGVLAIFSSCEKDEGDNLPSSDDTKIGVIPKISKTENSDTSINLLKSGATHFEFEIDVLDGEFSTLQLCVAYNENYAIDKQYVITEISEVPQTVAVDIDDIVESIDELNDTTDLQPGDKFEFFVNVVKENGNVLRSFIWDGTETDGQKGYTCRYNSKLRNDPKNNFIVTALAAYVYVPSRYAVTYDVEEVTLSDSAVTTYQATVEIDSGQPETGLIIYDLWIPPSEFHIEVDTSTFEVTAEDQIVYTGDFTGLGKISFEKTREGIINTDTKVITFITQPNLPDTGYWWNTDVKYTLTRASSEKTSNEPQERKEYDYLLRRKIP